MSDNKPLMILIFILFSCTHNKSVNNRPDPNVLNIKQEFAYLGNGNYKMRTFFTYQEQIPPYKFILYDSSVYLPFDSCRKYKHPQYQLAKRYYDSVILSDHIPFDSIELLKKY